MPRENDVTHSMKTSTSNEPLFRPDELSADGVPTIAAVRRVMPETTAGRTDEEVRKLGFLLWHFQQVWLRLAQARTDEQILERGEKYAANRRKYLRAKDRRRVMAAAV